MSFIGREEWEKLERLEQESIESLRPAYIPETSVDIGAHIEYLHACLDSKDVEGARAVRRAAIRLGHDSLLYFTAVCEDGIKNGYDPREIPPEETPSRGSRLVTYDEKLEALKNSLGKERNGRRGFAGDHIRTKESDAEFPSSTGSLYKELFWDDDVDLPFYTIAPKVVAFVNGKSVSDARRFHTNELEAGVLSEEADTVEKADELKNNFYRMVSSSLAQTCAASVYVDPNLLRDLIELEEAVDNSKAVAKAYLPIIRHLLQNESSKEQAFQVAEIVGLQIRSQSESPPTEAQN